LHGTSKAADYAAIFISNIKGHFGPR